MMAQIPLSAVTKKLDRTFYGSSIGNIIFWLTFCVLGQPMAVMLYTLDCATHQSGAAGVGPTALPASCHGPSCEL